MFETYEEEVDDDGMVEIEATFPEGETMRVYVDKKPAPKSAKLAKKRTHTPAPHPLAAVWIVVQTDYEHHTDQVGHSHVASTYAYDTIKDANESAREILMETCGADDSDGKEELEFDQEENRGSSTKEYTGWLHTMEDDRDSVKVEVTKLKLHSSAPAPIVDHHAALGRKRKTAPSLEAPRAAKKKGRDEEVIILSSD